MTRPCAGPQPLRPSAFKPPPGATDCHAHTFGPYDRFPLAADRSYTPPPATRQDFIAHLDCLGLSRGVVVTASVLGTDNSSLVDALEAYPDRLRGVAVLGPDTTDAEIDRLHAAGVRGIRLNLTGHGGGAAYANGTGLETLRALGHRIAERGWHLQAWLSALSLEALAPELEATPLDIVVDHMGRLPAGTPLDHPAFRLLCDKLRGGRYWCKLSGADRLTTGGELRGADAMAKALIAANPDRVVWGTDWPHVGYHDGAETPSDAALTDLLTGWLPDDALRRRVLVDNPARLYGFD
ncbi:amidohydrolase [Rhodovarius crocodyli]|uniref:Amidohydrolase n=1 Tax=Rhodovarius crocodyli TaxID=1979269 RepID=A0A437M282_9PROT|nr:amidohydrolase family protein [Rhodovarius crocodyli]RVT91722.1 amidohydrolase [Rhodovarius crocodyli]